MSLRGATNIARIITSDGDALKRAPTSACNARKFYDHVLREAKDSEAVARYMWMNPVRKGIVAEPHEYALSGSFTVEWPRISAPAIQWLPPWKKAAGTR